MICEKCGIEYEEDSCPACAAVSATAVAEEANELPPCAENTADITAMEQSETISECAEAEEQTEAITECAEADEPCSEQEAEPTPKRTLCNKCGTIYEGLNCPNCVAKAKIEMEKKRATEKKGKKLGLVGMIISLASLWASFTFYYGLHYIPVGILSLILSIIGKCKYKRSKTATVGIIVSILQMVFNVVMTILTVVGLILYIFLVLITASAGGLTISDIDSVF